MQNDKSEFKKRLYDFTLKLIVFLDKLPLDNISRKIGDQLLLCGTSIMGNYIKGQTASSNEEFTNYINSSLKSANESKLWFTMLLNTKQAKRKEVEWFLNEYNEISNMFVSSILK